jgi:hypothetical protein
MSSIGQNGGAELTEAGAQSSQSRQARVEGQDSQRRNAVMYSKLNRATTPPLGSIPRRSIISETHINCCSVVADTIAISLRSPGPSNVVARRSSSLKEPTSIMILIKGMDRGLS